MAFVVNDRVKEISVTTGTGTFTLDGAVEGFQTFLSAIGNTNTTYYAITNQGNLAEFEVGIGTVVSGTLTRDTIISSSNSDAVVTFSSGEKNVFCTLPASKAVLENDLGVASATTFSGSGAQLTNLNASNVASGTLPDARFPATLPAANGSALTDLNASNLASGTVPIARIDLNLLTTSTADADGDFFAVVDSLGAEKKLTKANINISGFNNDSGFIDGTSLNASNLDSGTVPDARFPATLPAASGANLTALNASNLSSGTVPDARFPATLPAISGANLTNLDASDLASGTVPIARIDLNLLTTSTADGDGDFFVVVDSVGAEKKLTKANINISGFNNNSGFTTNTGTVTSVGVTAGSGLTGGGTVTTSGTVTLNVGAGTGIDVAADAISVDVSDFMTNGVNNRVLTATGTDAMNAEANMTFDGTDLSIPQNIVHLGDTNCYIGFHATDQWRVVTGGVERFEVNDTAITAARNLVPGATDTYDLGAVGNVWRNLYTGDLHLSNEAKEEGNAVDGTKGNWTIQEGVKDLYILNNKSGKKYKFKLEEV
jgi:surfactin synthase thioesterase subunit